MTFPRSAKKRQDENDVTEEVESSTEVNVDLTVHKRARFSPTSTSSSLDNHDTSKENSTTTTTIPNELIVELWEYYRSYDEDEALDESGECDIDEINEIIEKLTPYLERINSMAGDVLTFESSTTDADLSSEHLGYARTVQSSDIVRSFRSIESLLKALLSMAYQHLGSYNISLALQYDGDDGSRLDEENKTPDHYLEESLKIFPGNAASLSILANYKRIHTMDTTRNICEMYELASSNAQALRDGAIMILDADDEEEEIEDIDGYKEYVERLLLSGMAGVEYLGNEEEEEENDDDEEEEENDDDEEEKDDDDEKEDIEVKENCNIEDNALQEQKHNDDINNDTEFSFSQVEATASFMAAQLYSTAGYHDKAAHILKKFGVTHRIHPKVWKYANDSRIVNGKTSDSLNDGNANLANNDSIPFAPHTFKGEHTPGILPNSLYKRMCKIFSPSAPYWKDSDYNCRGYYSFFSNLSEVERQPSNIIDDVIVNHLLPLAKSALPRHEQHLIVGYEWWTHHRSIQANLGHQLHFDTDESLLAQTHEVTHPIISSVLYLTGCNSDDYHHAGSTIVFNQTPDSERVASNAYISYAKDNSYMVFPGECLHGVLPCPGRKGKKISDEPHRLTFMVGFWSRLVPEKMKERNLYGPCGPMPSLSDPDSSWVNEAQEGYKNRKSSHDEPRCKSKMFALPCVSPAWDNCCNGDDEEINRMKMVMDIPQNLDHRFFVKNAPNCFSESLFKDESF